MATDTLLHLADQLKRAQNRIEHLLSVIEQNKNLMATEATEFQALADKLPMPHAARAQKKYLEIKEAIEKIKA